MPARGLHPPHCKKVDGDDPKHQVEQQADQHDVAERGDAGEQGVDDELGWSEGGGAAWCGGPAVSPMAAGGPRV